MTFSRWLALAALVSLAIACSRAGEPVHRTHGSSTPSNATAPIDAQASGQGAVSTVDASAVVASAVDASAVDAGPVDAGAITAPAGTGYAAVLRSADWAQWPGLPPELREADLVRDLALGRTPRTRHHGRLSRRDAVIVEAPGLRYWLRDRDRVVLIEVTERLGAAAPAALRSQLGRADREAAGRFLQSGATTTEYVYAGRGLALTVAESYDQPPRFAPRLAAVQLFAATDLRTFALDLGGSDRGGPSR